MDEDIIKELIWEKDRESSIAIGRKTKVTKTRIGWMNQVIKTTEKHDALRWTVLWCKMKRKRAKGKKKVNMI